MEIKFRGTYQKKLFFMAVRLANQSKRRNRLVQPLMLVFILVAVAVLIYRLIISGDFLGNASYIAVVMIAGAFLINAYLQPYLAARKLWKNKNLQVELKGKVYNEGVEYKLPQGKNLIPWARINRVRKVSSVTTLVTKDGLMLVFPRYFFKNDNDWLKFNNLVDTRIISM
ncbi:hypothetical protein ACFLXB_05160 [Chloroflexota bacterium]